MLSYSMKISLREYALLQAMSEIKYGEVFGVDPEPQPETIDLQISENFRSLLDILREGTSISVLTVHQGEPVAAEIDEKIKDFRCRKKVKFPTR